MLTLFRSRGSNQLSFLPGLRLHSLLPGVALEVVLLVGVLSPASGLQGVCLSGCLLLQVDPLQPQLGGEQCGDPDVLHGTPDVLHGTPAVLQPDNNIYN